jgi:hypothetical protein
MMTSKLGVGRATRTEDPMSPPTTVALSRLALEALVGKGEIDSERAGARLAGAIRFYLGDRGSEQAAWPYPSFLRGSEVQEDLSIPFEVEEELWRLFAAEAATQDVSAQQLAEHAAFYLAAEIDAGRVTQRILDDLAPTETESDSAETAPPPV